MSPWERYKDRAAAWHKAGRQFELLETSQHDLLVLICWVRSEGSWKENWRDDASSINVLIDFMNASAQSLEARIPYWFHDMLHRRDYCEECAERYMVENLTLCTGCRSMLCYRCVSRFKPGANGNLRHNCLDGAELVG